MQLSMSVALCNISLYPKRRIDTYPIQGSSKSLMFTAYTLPLLNLTTSSSLLWGGNFFSGGVTEAEDLSCRCSKISPKEYTCHFVNHRDPAVNPTWAPSVDVASRREHYKELRERTLTCHQTYTYLSL